ncbi:radical SAM protein [Candidatus Gottesmanbacteria bacterium]|nr:radical SAM protein [Candidatus Gottesmanbacteria bacterium]
MKILLIYPPVTIYGPGKVSPHPPLGLAYLAAYLEKRSYQIAILDCLADGKYQIKVRGKFTRVGLTEAEIKKRLKEFNPRVVGISVMFTAFASDAYRLASLVKQVLPKAFVVFGGAHVSIDPKEIVKDKNVDVAVKGEGEVVFLNLIRAIEKKESLAKISGITYRQGKKIIQNLAMGFIENLDELPFPARHLLPMELYQEEDEPFVMRHPLTSMITSRGCPGHCVYCSIHAIWGHTWRGRSAQNVIEEIEHLIKNYGIREIHFQDDSMSVNKRRMHEICDEILRRKIDIKWATPNGIAHWMLDKDLLTKMKKSGCYRVTFGIESGNPQMRRWVGKPYSLEQAKELTDYANKIGLWTVATNIIGFPYETEDQINDTIQFAIDSDTDFALFFRLGPRPGTPVYEIFKKEGWLPKNERELYSESVAVETKYIKGKKLYEIQNQAYSRFFKRRFISFLNPLRTVRKIHSWEDLRYVSGLGLAGMRMIVSLIKSNRGVTSKTLRV